MTSSRDPAEQVAAARRDARAVQLRASGLGYRAIGRELHIATSTAYEAVQAGLAAARREPSEHLIELEAEHLDRLRRDALAVLTAEHPLVQGGEIIHGEDGRQLQDAGPVLGAIRALLGIAERRAKLLGLDAPTRVDMHATLATAWAKATERERIQVLDADIEAMRAELDRRHGEGAFQREVEAFQREQQQPDPEALAGLVEAALDAAGISPGSPDYEAAIGAVEARLRATGNGGPR